MTYDFSVPTEPLHARVRDVMLGLWLASLVGGIAFSLLVGPSLLAYGRGELTGQELSRAMVEPTVWTDLVVVLFELFWVARLVLVKGSGDFTLDLGFRFRLVDLGYGFAGWVAIFVGGEVLDRFVLPHVLPGADDPVPFNPLDGYTEVPPLLKLVLLLTIGLLVPFAEEMLFRGVLLRTFSRWVGPIAAIALSSIVFGWLHATSWTARDLAHVAWAIWAGLVLGVLRVGTDRLGPGIVAHGLQNSIIVALTVLST